MKSDAELAAIAIGAGDINQSAYGLTISGTSAAPGGGEGESTKAADGKLVRLGDVSSDGKVTVTSGAGGVAEISVAPDKLTPKRPEPDRPPPPIRKTFSEMAIRAATAASTTSSKSRSPEQGM